MTVTPFRQTIELGDNGLDVMAVKRALRKMGRARGIILGYHAGSTLIKNIKIVQLISNLKGDGIYGRKTHEVVAAHFDGYGVWLYTHAQIRHRTVYVNPFMHSYDLEPGRTDMGVDYHGKGPIAALGNCRIVALGGNGWPGGEFIHYHLTAGEHAGRYVYVAEAVAPTVRPGQHVGAGGTIAYFRHDAFPGTYPGIETGWASSITNLTWCAVTTGYVEGEESRAGKAFARMLKQVGAPVHSNPGPGPTFE